MKTTFAILTLSALLAPALCADLKTDLDNAALVQPGDHANWVKARNIVIGHGADALAQLTEAAKPENWTAQGWVRALAAEVARLRISQPELAAKVDTPRGINPEFYTSTRLGKPFCRRDFAQLGTEGVPLMLERLRWTLNANPFSEGDAGALEKEALATSLIEVPGQLADTRARFAMLVVLRDAELPANWRQDAAVSYGQTGGEAALEELGAVLDNARKLLAVREACAWAIGRVAENASVEALRLRLADARLTGGDNGPALVRAMVSGLGTLGGAWGWNARGAAQLEKGNQVRRECAQLLLETLKQHPAEHEVIGNAFVQVELRDSLGWLEDLSKDAEAAQVVKDAALKCIAPLKDALNRAK